MANISDFTYPNKPPRYWIAAKRRVGMINESAWGRIWFHIYNDERRMLAWMAAPDEDWAACGMKKPELVR